VSILQAIKHLWFGEAKWVVGEVTLVRAAAKRAGDGTDPPFLMLLANQVAHVGPLSMKYLRDFAREQIAQGLDVEVVPVEHRSLRAAASN
jgi:hypothetical protein